LSFEPGERSARVRATAARTHEESVEVDACVSARNANERP
jgi:hypothetical protein